MYAGENGYPTRQGKALNGVAPRGGFAWSLSNKDVIRGGYGFYWAPMQFSGVGETAMGRLGYTATTTYLASTDGNRTPANSLSNPFPAGITPPQGNSQGLATGAGGVIDFVDQNSQARPGAPVFGRLHARAARRHRGVDRLLGQPIRAHAGRRHGGHDGEHQPARPAVPRRSGRRCSIWCRIRFSATPRSATSRARPPSRAGSCFGRSRSSPTCSRIA